MNVIAKTDIVGGSFVVCQGNALGPVIARIVTSNIFPPIPDRRFDWCAFYEGQEERGEYGYGRTESEAVNDLVENWECP